MPTKHGTGLRRQRNVKLQGLRINHGLSINDLARMANVSEKTIRLAEQGYTPGPRIQFQIAAVFDVLPLDIWPMSRQRAA